MVRPDDKMRSDLIYIFAHPIVLKFLPIENRQNDGAKLILPHAKDEQSKTGAVQT